jgi:hypothetical protein
MKPFKNIKNKINETILKIMEESVDIKLYLLQEKGPLSFTFQEEKNAKKINVSIGSHIECTCAETNRNEHCVHTIYVLNRFFKLKFNDPLILQTSFSDAELSKMIEIRMKKNEKIDTNKLQKHHSNNQSSSVLEISEGNRMHLSDDPSCPICQEDMYTSEKLFYCSKSCGHNFHMHCMKVWVEHKKVPNTNHYDNSSVKLTCPMCRGELDEELLAKYQSQHSNNSASSYNPKLSKPHKNINCKICSRTNIKGDRLHCLICDNFDFCIECLSKHENNHFLICKRHPEDNWNGCEIVNNSIQIKSVKLSQYLINCLEYTEIDAIEENEIENEENSGNGLEHSSNVIERKCIICNGNKKSKLDIMKYKKLTCGHILHVKCCEKVFSLKETENYNKCALDKSFIFKGLLSVKLKNAEAKKTGVDNVPIKSNNQNSVKGIVSINDLLVINKFNSNNSNNISTNNKKILPNSSINKKRPQIPNSSNTINNTDFSLALNIQKVDFKDSMNVKSYENEEKEKYKALKSAQKRNTSVKNPKKPPSLAFVLNEKKTEEEKQEIPIVNNNKHRNIKVVDLKIMNFKVNKFFTEAFTFII